MILKNLVEIKNQMLLKFIKIFITIIYLLRFLIILKQRLKHFNILLQLH